MHRAPASTIARLAPLALAVLAGCAAPLAVPDDSVRSERVLSTGPRVGPTRGLPTAESDPSGAELAYIKVVLTDLQVRSFAQDREICGYLGLDREGRLTHTEPQLGTEASCRLPMVPPGFTLVASFHTHGTYSPYYASEWPTTQDVATDASDDIDGYISTPGGRLWHVDTDTLTVTQICGRGCLPQDPRYVAADDGPVRTRMTYADLLAWERS